MTASYRPRYHVSVPFGWANDPNGLICFQGKVHLFHQHYPHKPEWGPMHWDHVTTEDFVHWEKRPVALYPDKPVLTAEMLSPEIYEEDFRDPRIFMRDGVYYLIAGIRYLEGGHAAFRDIVKYDIT